MTSIFDQHLPRNEANFAALSPLSFIERTAEVYPDRLAIVHGELRQTWAQTYARCRQLASALQRLGIDSRFVVFPDENHWILKPANSLQWHAEVLGWLGQYLQSPAGGGAAEPVPETQAAQAAR